MFQKFGEALYFVFVSCFVVSAFGQQNDHLHSNRFMDGLLRNELQNVVRLRQLDPKAMPNFQATFFQRLQQARPAMMQIDYTRGTVRDLSLVSRAQDCTHPYVDPRATFQSIFNCTLTFPRLNVAYTGWVRKPEHGFRVEAEVIEAEILVEMSRQRTGDNPGLRSLTVVNTGAVSPTFSNLVLDLERAAIRNLTRTFRGQVAIYLYHILNNDFRNAFTEAVQRTRRQQLISEKYQE